MHGCYQDVAPNHDPDTSLSTRLSTEPEQDPQLDSTAKGSWLFLNLQYGHSDGQGHVSFIIARIYDT